MLKVGAYLPFYVNGGVNPVVNWTDHNSPAWGIGGFGIATDNTRPTFTDIRTTPTKPAENPSRPSASPR